MKTNPYRASRPRRASMLLFAVSTATLLFLSAGLARALVPASRVGDVDGDGSITVKDALLSLLDSLGLQALPPDQLTFGPQGRLCFSGGVFAGGQYKSG